MFFKTKCSSFVNLQFSFVTENVLFINPLNQYQKLNLELMNGCTFVISKNSCKVFFFSKAFLIESFIKIL